MDPEVMANAEAYLKHLATAPALDPGKVVRGEVHNTLLVVLQVLKDQQKQIEALKEQINGGTK